MSKFNQDLGAGNLGEYIFAQHLKNVYNFTIKSFNNDSRFDIHTLYKNKDIKFEIKTDRYEYFKNIITNNMFIELSYNNKKSGLNATEADIFVYYYPDIEEAFMIKVNKLKRILKEHPECYTYKTLSGDGCKSRGVTINRKEYRHLFKVINIPKSKEWDKDKRTIF